MANGPRRSSNKTRAEKMQRSWKKNQEAKKKRIAEQKEREKANIAARRDDPDGLTPYQRRKYEKNKARCIEKYGSFRPGMAAGGE